MILSVSELRTYFHAESGTARAVDGVTLSVGEGEILGIVGESGCGKSVTALSIMGLVRPPGEVMPGSSIRYGDRELTTLSARELREVRGREIGMVFQEPMTSLNPVYRVGDQIGEPLRQHLGMDRKAARGRAVELLRTVGIASPEQRVDAYPHQLSGGMRQRVMIAMALACEPGLLIADEPTTALDVTIQAQILELLLGLRDRLGMAILLITHDLGVVAEACDRVVVMYAGQVVEEAPVSDLFRDPRHPYTEGLLGAIPRRDRQAGPLAVIPGVVPPATRWPDGCRFRTRCPYGWSLCAREEPPLLAAGAGRSRCWLELHPERRGTGGFRKAADAPVPDGAP